MTTKRKGLNGVTPVQPGNYRKGVWDAVSETALDTEASHIVAQSHLGAFADVDRYMDQHQEVGYAFVKAIAEGSSDPEARRGAQSALIAFGRAEILEQANEEHVKSSTVAVKDARKSNHKVIGVAETNRRSAAMAQSTSTGGLRCGRRHSDGQ